MKGEPYIFKRPSSKKYAIRKYYDKKMYYFGSYCSLEDAKKVRDVLVSVNFGFPKNPMSHIIKDGNYWLVRKISEGEVIWSRWHKSLEKAQAERDLLMANDWDVDAIDDTINGEISMFEGVKKGTGVLFETHKNGRNDVYMMRNSGVYYPK